MHLIHIIPGGLAAAAVCRDTPPHLILHNEHTELLHLLAQFLDVVADDAVIDVHVSAVVEQVQGAFHIDFQSRGNMVGFFLVLLEQGIVQVLKDGHILRAGVRKIFAVDQMHTAVNDGFLYRQQTLLAAHHQFAQGKDKVGFQGKRTILLGVVGVNVHGVDELGAVGADFDDRQYELVTGRRQKSDVIAYQIRQSFKPGEITAEEANKVGYELAMRFTKGKYAFIVATHTDRKHIHNHIIYNSTALDSTRKFRDFLLSGLTVQRLSDLICLEHQLSVIEIKPYRERQKRTLYPPRESNRDKLCAVIDNILLNENPVDFEIFLQKLEQQGYVIKRGKHTSVKGARQKRFIRFRTLGAEYSEEELKAVISGEAEHHPRQKQKRIVPEQKFQMLVDIQAKLAEGKSMGYARWAKRYNLKEMSKTLIFLQEHKIGSIEEMRERVNAATAQYHELGDSIKAVEQRMAEIAVLRTHIVNYARTRPVYDAYRKTGYSKHFLETHRTEITLHKAAKAAFNESNLKTLPKVKELDMEYSKLLTEKKARYPDYRKAKEEMQEFLRAKRNVELFFAEEKSSAEKMKSR